jgi:uncharacterized protein YvpB
MPNSTALPPNVRLDVPYRSQLDNRNNPSGSCNVTAITMALLYFGKKGKHPQMQFEDELYEYMLDGGLDRHAPEDLAQVVRDYGCRDEFTKGATIEMAHEALANNMICVIHGYFTRYGHVVTLVGYTPEGLWVHDPNGEYFIGGYDTRANGAYLHYSNNLIRRVAMPDGQLWLHRISA